MTAEFSEGRFERLADQTLNALLEALDALDNDRLEAELAAGVLSVEIEGAGKMVVNSHRAARQIWMAAGATAWHFDWDGQAWRSTKGAEELWATLREQTRQRLGEDVQLQR